MKRFKSGFTMAETIVTLGIVGVLAVISLTAIHNAKPNEEAVLLRKAYYELNRVVKELVNDDDLYPGMDKDTCPESKLAQLEAGTQDYTDCKKEHDKYLYTQGLGDTRRVYYNGRYYEGPTKFCELLREKMNTRILSTDNNCKAVNAWDKVDFHTVDGIGFGVWTGELYWSEEKQKLNTDGINIYVFTKGGPHTGVNAVNKYGHCFCRMEKCEKCPKPDVFNLDILSDGTILANTDKSALKYLGITSEKVEGTSGSDDMRKRRKWGMTTDKRVLFDD